ncbi:hypothetical protein [Thomasclavelia sp.]
MICSDGNYGYRKLAANHQLELHAFGSKSKEKRGIYHIYSGESHFKIKNYVNTALI